MVCEELPLNKRGQELKIKPPIIVAGRVAARARGRHGGRPEKYGSKDIEMMKSLIESGTPIKDVAEKCGVSRTTIYSYLEKQ